MATLDKHQAMPLTSEELEAFREAAKASAFTSGLFARALLRYALAHLDDPAVLQAIADEKAAAAQRLSDGAKIAVAARWGTTK